MIITVRVPKNLIDNGTRGSCVDCPAARAIRLLGFKEAAVRQLSRITNSYFYGAYVVDLFGDFDYRRRVQLYYELPPKVAEKIRAFDEGKSMSPFSFDMHIPGWVVGSHMQDKIRWMSSINTAFLEEGACDER